MIIYSMKGVPILIFFLFLSLLSQINPFNQNSLFSYLTENLNNDFQTVYQSDENLEKIYNSIRELISNVVNNTITKNSSCYKDLNKTILNSINRNISEYFIRKLIEDSSRHINDISSSRKCSLDNHGIEDQFDNKKTKLFLVEFNNYNRNDIKSTKYEEGWYLLGTCFPINISCSKSEYEKIMNKAWSIFLEENANFKLIQNDELSGTQKIFIFIPLLLIILIALIFILQLYCFCCCKFCFKKSKGSFFHHEKEKSQGVRKKSLKLFNEYKSPYSKKAYRQFVVSSSINSNMEELFDNRENTRINNSTGLAFILGIRGTALIIFTFGMTFINLFNAPNFVYDEDLFINFLRSGFFSIFFAGIRYCPRIILSCSGFCLFHKLMCYLDENVLNILKSKESRDENKKEDKNEINNKIIEESELHTYKRESKDVPWSLLFKFYLYQIHKYIIFLLIFMVFRFSLYYIVNISLDYSSLAWEYLGNRVLFPNKLTFINFLKSITTVQNYIIYSNDNSQYDEYFIYSLWLFACEVLGFIFFSLIIFLGYKYELKIHFFFYFIFSVFLALKLALIFKNIDILSNQFMYFSNNHFGYWFKNPVYNLEYYLIGIFFSFLNYIHQKSMGYKEVHNQQKKFLLASVTLLSKLRKISHFMTYILAFIGFIIIIATSFSQTIFAQLSSKENHFTNLFNNKCWNSFLSFDIEIVTILMHYIGFTFHLKGNNIIDSFFSGYIWKITEKLYFFYMIMINLVELVFFALTDTQLELFSFIPIFFSLVFAFLTFMFSCIGYIFLELPGKRIIKLILNSISTSDESESRHDSNEIRTL